jgi:hypothetical protein
VEISDVKSMHSEPMKAQIAIFLLSSPVEVGGCPCVSSWALCECAPWAAET